MDPRHAVLFEPIAIGPKTLPNRFYQVPHASGFGVEKPRTQAAFRGIKAEGGWGGVCVDYTSISLEAEESPAVSALFWDDEDAKALGLSADAVHAHGALAGIELFHGGGHSENGQSRATRVAPTQSRSHLFWSGLAKEMDTDDIARIQREWVDAARRARDVGFDIVYVYGAHGYLLSQFFSTVLNRRADEYGGSLQNRGRFWLETLEGVKDAVGDDCAVATRIPVSGRDGLPGIEIDDMLELIRMASPLVDLFDVNVGLWEEDSGTSRYYPEGHERQWTDRVREATDQPVVGVGRYTSADLMADIVRTRALDIIGAARPAIADPFLPTKIREGRLDDIRECTGSNVCIAREETYNQVACIQNATAGEEFRRGWHPELFTKAQNADRAALVVGAGPAGMECAIVLGKRGFEAVHLVDAASEIGGSLRWTRQLPTLGDWGRIIDHRVIQLDKLDSVEVICGRRLTASDVLDYGAQLVVVATGSTWRGDGVQFEHADMRGADASLPYVMTPEQVMVDGKRPPRGQDEQTTVVVYDSDGYYVGPGMAEQLAGEGYDVHLVTPFGVVSPVSDASLEGEVLRQHLHRVGVTAHRGVALTDIADDAVHGLDEFGQPWTIASSGVVLVTQRKSDDSLYRELLDDPDALTAAGIEAVYAIGDAVAPRPISEAVFDGHRLAREIDSDNPMRPLPYLRERTLL
ncbi:MAG TPA: NAD(P)-binding protein [Actinomycetes bacterium]|nr:NAD(P)-binding protein [Actinomycetes bacterium]